MKLNLFSLLVLLIILFTSCTKEDDVDVMVVKDCSGVYLRLHNNDYKVCNLEKVAPFQNGEFVKATFSQMKECNGSANNTVVCMIVHQNLGWIEVEKIN